MHIYNPFLETRVTRVISLEQLIVAEFSGE